MDILKIQYPVGTVIVDVETKERLVIESYIGNKMYLSNAFTGNSASWDYFTHLGKLYVKDKTAQVLFGHSRSNRNSR